MAESSSEPASDLLIKPVSKELIVTTAMEGLGRTPGSDTGAEVQRSNGDADSPLPAKVPKEEEEEATPSPPESSSLSSENGTMTAITTEEESVSALLRHMETEGGRDRGADPGKTQVLRMKLNKVSETRCQGSACVSCWFRVWLTFRKWSRETGSQSGDAFNQPLLFWDVIGCRPACEKTLIINSVQMDNVLFTGRHRTLWSLN